MSSVIETILPQSLSEDTKYYVRGTFGAMAAYSFAVNPLVGGLVLAGHAVWEFAGLYMRPEVSEQQLRVEKYSQAFDALRSNAVQLGSKCSKGEFEKAKNIFFVHNLIEEVCYKALPEIVQELGITSDEITEEQSGKILAYLKRKAHVELRKEGGYSKKGREMITPDQFDWVIENINTIIHDRDGRLTDARYTSLTDLCVAVDDHNNYVKNTLFQSWFKCKDIRCGTHLAMIKEIVGLNALMTEQLGFDFEKALQEKKEYFDCKHPNIREIKCAKTGKHSAQNFVNLSEVRGKFCKEKLLTLGACDREANLIECLKGSQLFTSKEIHEMVTQRSVTCYPRFHSCKIDQPKLLDPKITVGQFFDTYFPEYLEQELLHKDGNREEKNYVLSKK